MKIKSLILAMAACAGLFTACSNEIEGVDESGNKETEKAEAYMSVSFTLPAGGANSRAYDDNDGQGSEVGSTGENKISNAYVYLFKDDVLAVAAKKIQIIDPSTSDSKDQLDTKPFTIATGTYKVYVIVNAETSNNSTIDGVVSGLTELPAGTALANFMEAVNAYNSVASGNYCKANNFLMTNAYTIATAVNTNTDPDGVKTAVEGLVEVAATNSTQEKAARVNVHVERAAAKISYSSTSTDNIFDVTNSAANKIGTVTLTSFKVVNTRNNSYLFRRVKDAANSNSDLADVTGAVYGGDETHTTTHNYVIDNVFMSKTNTFTTAEEFYASNAFVGNYTKKENAYVKWRVLPKTTTTASATLTYCMENTMNKSAQLVGFTTRIIFRAIFTPEANFINEDKWIETASENGTVANFSTSKTFYRFANKYYRTITEIAIGRYGVATGEAGAVAALNNAYNDNYLAIQEKITTLTGDLKTKWDAAVSADNALAKAIILKSVYENSTIYTQKYLNSKSIEKYVDGYCYYHYQIRHRSNTEKNGLMEFATVRNNVYKLSITSIGNLGDHTSGTPGVPETPGTVTPGDEDGDQNPENPCTPDTENPNPGEPSDPDIILPPVNPDETTESWLNVKVEVLKWTIRNNGIIL